MGRNSKYYGIRFGRRSWFPYERTIAIDSRRSQMIAEDRTWCYLLRSSAITITGSQTIAEVCFHMIPQLLVICDHMETSLYQ